MTHYWDFTLDEERYNMDDMKKFFNTSEENGVHWIPIVDAGIALNYTESI